MSTGVELLLTKMDLFFSTRVAGIRDFVNSLKLILMVYIFPGIFCFSAEMNFFLLSENKMCASDCVSRILFHTTEFKYYFGRENKNSSNYMYHDGKFYAMNLIFDPGQSRSKK